MKPILFKTNMVQAILDGRKSMTRRVISPQPFCHGINLTEKHKNNQLFSVTSQGSLKHCRICGSTARSLRPCSPRRGSIDPVMVAKGGCALMQRDALCTLISQIIPLAYVLTPNIPEAQAITGIEINDEDGMKRAARIICDMGAANVLIKGGHLSGDARDLLFDASGFEFYTTRRIPTKNTHGTGCTFSSAIAANLAKGMDIRGAVRLAKDYITTAIEHALSIGKGHGPTNHFYELYKKGGLI